MRDVTFRIFFLLGLVGCAVAAPEPGGLFQELKKACSEGRTQEVSQLLSQVTLDTNPYKAQELFKACLGHRETAKLLVDTGDAELEQPLRLRRGFVALLSGFNLLKSVRGGIS